MIRIDTPEDVAELLRLLRQLSGMTQSTIEARTGIHFTRVSRIERGEVVPDTRTLIRLLAALGHRLAIVPLIETAPETALSATETAETPSAGVLGCAEGSQGESGASGATADCGHCGGPQRGYAALGDTPLCHPDGGLDCYRLVTVYGHGAPCITQPCCDPEPWRRGEAQVWNWTLTADGMYSGPHGPDICPNVGCQHEGGAA